MSTPKKTIADESASGRSPSSVLVDDIATEIRTKVMSGEIPIGSQLRQADLAKKFGVSRTPVREALRQLQSGGLIDVNPNRGAVVRVPAPWEVREAYEVRAELEGLAAARAVTRITGEDLHELRNANEAMYARSLARSEGNLEPSIGGEDGNERFHRIIARSAQNAHLAKSITSVNQNFPRNVTALLLVNDSRHRDKNYKEHESIIAAIEAGDEATARRAMRDHVIAAGEHLAQWYEQRSSTVFLGS